MKSLIKIAFVAVMAFFITSCCSCRKGSPVVGTLETSNWSLIEFEGTQTPQSGIVLTFDAEKKMIYGQAPCNNFFAGYSLPEGGDQNIKINAGGQTMKACPDTELENKFVSQIHTLTKAEFDSKGSIMMLSNAEGKVMAVFQAVAK